MEKITKEDVKGLTINISGTNKKNVVSKDYKDFDEALNKEPRKESTHQIVLDFVVKPKKEQSYTFSWTFLPSKKNDLDAYYTTLKQVFARQKERIKKEKSFIIQSIFRKDGNFTTSLINDD
jgi:hypothetical protein